ncbi:hypothetical protein [Rhizobium aethiopicum]|uniref:Uncharacterized protein n=1 Tax=Rhizobium aethiopicum TaxID=1138170 RepID=A0A7W6Q8P4_9HYPH|nr:hypothetical protein [Rhizobium aethiopicum]MBB4192753.1 hypothetical protein [Rhizobium aethiopicum]
MTRQMRRAAARRQAKIDRANARQPGSYPASHYVPFVASGKTYGPNGAREVARRRARAAA